MTAPSGARFPRRIADAGLRLERFLEAGDDVPVPAGRVLHVLPKRLPFTVRTSLCNKQLRRLLERVNADRQLKGWWHVANVNAVVRLEINDHSWVHIQIVANIALKLLRQLTKHGVEPAVVRDYGMTQRRRRGRRRARRATHCVGMSVHRDGHEDLSLFLAEPKLRELLDGIYDEPDRTVIVSEVLQAITSHRADGEPLSLEAGILRVADALDMAQGPLADPVRARPASRSTRSRPPRSRRSRSRTARRSRSGSRS